VSVFDEGERLTIVPGADAGLVQVQHLDLDAVVGQCPGEGLDRADALMHGRVLRAVDTDLDPGAADAVVLARLVSDEPYPRALAGGVEVSVFEDGPEVGCGDFCAGGVGVGLDLAGEVDLHSAGQFDTVLGFQQVGDAALAGLGVHSDHGVVAAADIGGVDGQVRHPPRDRRFRLSFGGGLVTVFGEALLDRVLVGAAERGVGEVADVGVSGVDLDAVAVLDGAADLVDVGEVDHRVDALGVQVQCEGGDVDVAGAFPVAEDAALDPLRPGQHGQFRAGDPGAAVVVGVHRQYYRIPACEVGVHVLDLVGVHVRSRDLDGRGQVQDHRPLRSGAPQFGDGVADVDHEVGFGEVE